MGRRKACGICDDIDDADEDCARVLSVMVVALTDEEFNPFGFSSNPGLGLAVYSVSAKVDWLGVWGRLAPDNSLLGVVGSDIVVLLSERKKMSNCYYWCISWDFVIFF